MRIALASPPIPRSIDDGLNWIKQHAAQAAQAGADIICFPESFIPGMRGQDFPVEAHAPAKLQAARDAVCAIAKELSIFIILPMDWESLEGLRNTAFVISDQGDVVGQQTKNQLDPSEDALYVPGQERMLFEARGLRFGIAICHEGWRYPETVRWTAVRGAHVVFHPHYTGSQFQGRTLSQWGDSSNPYYEKAMICRAVENNIFFASVNYAMTCQESATSLISPSGECIAHQPYGEVGVLVTEIEIAHASGLLAQRFAPERYVDAHAAAVARNPLMLAC